MYHMNSQEKYATLGIDIGSTTVKIAILDEEHNILFSDYERHFANIRETLSELLKKAYDQLGELQLHPMITGSGGLTLANHLGVPFTQEVVAVATSLQELAPKTDVAIELGGEDAKIIYFEGGNVEQRMNGICAGGTGSFIDQMASLIQTDASGLNEYAKNYKSLYTIAARCGVFAKTDIQPLINEGATKEDLSASIFQAVVNQTISGLACGKPIRGHVAFLGGPLHFLSELKAAFIRTLNLDDEHIIDVDNSHLFAAIGSALNAKEDVCISLSDMVKKLSSDIKMEFEVERMEPLFADQAAYKEFVERHSKHHVTTGDLQSYQGKAFLGIDAGSTTTKIALVGEDGSLLYSFYSSNDGSPLKTAIRSLKEIYSLLPEGVEIVRSCSTGYGEALMKAAFLLDDGEVETVAHYYAAAFFDPTKPIYDEENRYNGYWNWGIVQGAQADLATQNPLSLLYDRNNHGTTKRSLGNIQLDYKIHGLEDLHANLNLGYDVAKTTGRNFVNSNSVQSSLDKTFTGLGQGNTWNNLRRNHLLDFYMNYAKNIESIKSNFDIMAGYSWQHFYYANHDITYSNPTEDLGAKEGYTYDENERHYIRDDHRRIPYENYLISFFGRLNYNFMDRYLLTATLRRDGSSRFSENNRWGLFPSAALAWTISNEPFMKATENVLSKLKLRLGYGVTGQQEIGDYQYITSYSFSTNPNTTYLGTTLLKPNGYSPDLKWEQTTTYNVAIDFGFLNNRINGSIEYYQKHTKDLLNTISAAAGTNFINLITANVGKMKNKGVEANVNAIAIQSKDFTWEVGYNITWNDSKITKLTTTFNPDYQGIDAGTNQKHQVGEMPGTFYLYQQVYDENGKPIQNAFVDRNNDGQITEADRYLTHKSPMAKIYMGFSSQFSYKKWDLGFNLRANFGNYVYNGVASGNSTSNNYGGKGFITNLYNGFQDTGFTLLNTSEQMASDYFLENASFLKMDNLTLGYSFQNLFAAKLSGRISASVQNVFTISKYSGLDPECGAIDSNIWPRPRTYTIGLNLNF